MLQVPTHAKAAYLLRHHLPIAKYGTQAWMWRMQQSCINLYTSDGLCGRNNRVANPARPTPDQQQEQLEQQEQQQDQPSQPTQH